jgi:predicted MFS family arabinose efflux permease
MDGSYFEDIFLGLLVFGTGLGAAFVASQIAALARVAEEESGFAAGLVDSSFNIGGALGSRSSPPLPCHAPTTR